MKAFRFPKRSGDTARQIHPGLNDDPTQSCTGPASAELRASTGLTSFLRKFKEREEGNLTVFSVFMFVGIVGICGIGVDLMMNEMQRTKLQNSLDSAVLAAANLNQDGNPETVVHDYVAANGMAGSVRGVDVNRTQFSSTVSAQAREDSDPFFLNVMGVDELSATAQATAENSAGNIEISMVLDISGSMGWRHNGERKITSLQRAASTFVDTVLDPNRHGRTSINLVSYNSYTNIGPTLAGDLLNNTDNCYHLRNSDFKTLGIRFREVAPNQGSRASYRDCNWRTSEEITVHQNNATVLKNEINELSAGGWTAIEVGMKWGLAFPDPSSNNIVRNMVSRGMVDPALSARPAAYSEGETSKIVVLMTDGENTVHSQQDQQLSRICGMARNQGVIIYTVAFAAPQRGINAMRSCASSDAHFFDVQNTDIEEAFSAIAASISKLRLTQ
ncbi:vWA domain-containing protein [Roseobacteraceae bacterium S113]